MHQLVKDFFAARNLYIQTIDFVYVDGALALLGNKSEFYELKT